jgi:hypothetical protein
MGLPSCAADGSSLDRSQSGAGPHVQVSGVGTAPRPSSDTTDFFELTCRRSASVLRTFWIIFSHSLEIGIQRLMVIPGVAGCPWTRMKLKP